MVTYLWSACFSTHSRNVALELATISVVPLIVMRELTLSYCTLCPTLIVTTSLHIIHSFDVFNYSFVLSTHCLCQYRQIWFGIRNQVTKLARK